MSELSYQEKVHSNGPDKLTVESGGLIDILAGGLLKRSGVAAISQVTQAVGVKASTTISVTCTAKDNAGNAVAGALLGYIASDAGGLTPVSTADTVAAGANGALIALVAHASFQAITDANGIVVVAITEATGSTNYYLVFVLPDGTLSVSAVLAF